MSATNPEPYSQKDKVTILLQEYNTLRQEIIARTTQGFQVLALGFSLLIWILQAKQGGKLWVVLACVAATLFATWITFVNLNNCVRRILVLEKDINTRAGENLLVWETQHPSNWMGFIRRAKAEPTAISAACISEKEKLLPPVNS